MKKVQGYIFSFKCFPLENSNVFKVRVCLKSVPTEDNKENKFYWYNLRGEKAIQRTLLLAKALRDKKAIEIEVDAETNEIKGLRERLE